MSTRTVSETERVARRLRLTGHVQGVGFRPFVYRLAQEFGIAGSVRNLQGEVEIIASAPPGVLERFEQALLERARSRLEGEHREHDREQGEIKRYVLVGNGSENNSGGWCEIHVEIHLDHGAG